MKIDDAKDKQISNFDYVTVTEMNHIIEVQYMEKMNSRVNIKKLSKDKYINLDTGEIRDFEHIENRKGSINSLRQTFKKLRYLINNNFVGSSNELFVTLTYAENMTDSKRLCDDLEKFNKKLRYKYKEETSIDNITVVEPQERGAWHAHILYKFNNLDKIYIPNQHIDNKPVNAPLFDMWGKGWVTVKSTRNLDNVGAYLTAYLTDIELNDETKHLAYEDNTEIIEREIDGQKKKFIKGGRLHLYPPGMNLYRKSKGIVYPDRKKMIYSDVKKIVGSATPHYSRKIDVSTNDFENTIIYEQYNMKRS